MSECWSKNEEWGLVAAHFQSEMPVTVCCSTGEDRMVDRSGSRHERRMPVGRWTLRCELLVAMLWLWLVLMAPLSVFASIVVPTASMSGGHLSVPGMCRCVRRVGNVHTTALPWNIVIGHIGKCSRLVKVGMCGGELHSQQPSAVAGVAPLSAIDSRHRDWNIWCTPGGSRRT